MSAPPSYDQDLLNRLNALKRSTVLLDPSKPSLAFVPQRETTPEADLSARLRSLRNKSSSSQPKVPANDHASSKDAPSLPSISAPIDRDSDPIRGPVNLDDKTLDELLADLGPKDQWDLAPEDPDDILKLLNEAKSALPSDDNRTEPMAEDTSVPGEVAKRGVPWPTKNKDVTESFDLSTAVVDIDGTNKGGERVQDDHDESREAQDIIAKMLDEVAFERENVLKENLGESQREPESGDNDGGWLNLPPAPSSLPSPQLDEPRPGKDSLDFESDIVARMAALKGLEPTDGLGLPTVPTFKPADKPAKTVMKKYTDEEIDSWCIICLAEATVQCFGCDGDLYCAICWKEGHMGPDVGMEEKRHKWAKYRKPK